MEEYTMKLSRMSVIAIGISAMCAVAVTAQEQKTESKTKTKIEVKDGKDITVSGCLERLPNGDYMLTKVTDGRHPTHRTYALVASEDLAKHVGERVEVKGEAVADGKGKVVVESKTKTSV